MLLRRRPVTRPLAGALAMGLCLTLTSATSSYADAVVPPRTKHVVAISIDGLNPDAIRELGPEGAPHLHRMMAEGTSTLNARSAYERTVTLPNHTSMLTGTRVNRHRGGHGVNFNRHIPGRRVHQEAGRYVMSVFDILHDRGRSTALYSGKSKFAMFDLSWGGRYGRRDPIGRSQGRDKIDTFRLADEERLTDAVVTQLTTAPVNLAFLHLAAPDRTGHEAGYMSQTYLDEVTAMDAHVGRVLDTVADDAYLRSTTTVVLTADHGGLGRNHSDPAKAVNYTVPFLAWGVGVTPGTDLYAINPTYRDPGTGRPAYVAARQPIRSMAVANLVTDLLGLPAVPRSVANTAQDLRLTR